VGTKDCQSRREGTEGDIGGGGGSKGAQEKLRFVHRAIRPGTGAFKGQNKTPGNDQKRNSGRSGKNWFDSEKSPRGVDKKGKDDRVGGDRGKKREANLTEAFKRT